MLNPEECNRVFMAIPYSHCCAECRYFSPYTSGPLAGQGGVCTKDPLSLSLREAALPSKCKMFKERDEIFENHD